MDGWMDGYVLEGISISKQARKQVYNKEAAHH